MKGAIGNSLFIIIIITFVGALAIFFTSILAYTKAYRVKNRIVEIIEKYEEYNTDAESEISISLAEMGYQIDNCPYKTNIDNNTGYKYCVNKKTASNGEYYEVSTYV